MLAQLALRMSLAMQSTDSNSDNPFAKVTGLITDMTLRLQEDAAAERV